LDFRIFVTFTLPCLKAIISQTTLKIPPVVLVQSRENISVENVYVKRVDVV